MTWDAQRLLIVGQMRARGHSFAEIGERFGMTAQEMRASYRGAAKRAARALKRACQDTHTSVSAGVPINERTGAVA